jgi:hypothetical protein
MIHFLFRFNTGNVPTSDFVLDKFVPNMFVKSNCPKEFYLSEFPGKY